MRRLRWARRALVALGVLIAAFAVTGALTDPDARPPGHLLFLVGVLVAHDAVLLPAAIGAGVLIGRYLPAGAQVAVRVAGFITLSLLVVATPLVLGFGRRTDIPSALPLHYGRGLAVTVLLVWIGVLAATLARRGTARVRSESRSSAGVGRRRRGPDDEVGRDGHVPLGDGPAAE